MHPFDTQLDDWNETKLGQFALQHGQPLEADSLHCEHFQLGFQHAFLAEELGQEV